MNLFLLRHAIASPAVSRAGFADSKRRLTPEGRKKMRRAAKGMKTLGLDFDLILTSPYQRALQTAEIVAQVFRATPRMALSEYLKPTGRSEELIRQILRSDRLPDDVLLVGHEPGLSNLISLLVSGSAGCCVTMKKGGLCKLATTALKAGRCATLEWLLTPRHLGLLA
jgi:phosphohistidine phosphatase